MFDQAGIDVATLQAYLVQHNLALLITRDVTSRDDADTQQPFNLRVPGGVQSVSSGGTLYDVTHLQIFQGDQLRGWTGGYSDTPRPGRRVLAQYLHEPAAVAANPVLPGAPTGSVAVAADGSVAAFVPARRAMTWQLTDASGNSVVRERYWITFQPGEVRMCTSCHGPSEKDQAERAAITNAPQALFALLELWESQNEGQPGATPTSIVATNTPTSNGTPTPVTTPSIVPTLAHPVDAQIYLPVITGQ